METDLNRKIKKTTEIIALAIKTQKPELLRRSIETLKKLTALPDAEDTHSDEKVNGLLEDCPLSLAEEAKLGIRIYSSLLEKEITLGQDISWEEIRKLTKSRIEKDSLRAVVEVQQAFGGKIVEIRKTQNTV